MKSSAIQVRDYFKERGMKPSIFNYISSIPNIVGIYGTIGAKKYCFQIKETTLASNEGIDRYAYTYAYTTFHFV